MLIRFSVIRLAGSQPQNRPRELPRRGRWDREKLSEDRYLETLPDPRVEPSSGRIVGASGPQIDGCVYQFTPASRTAPT